MLRHAIVVAAALILAPLGAKAADLVIWWDEGFTAQEAEAAAEIVDAFETSNGGTVKLIFHPQLECPQNALAAVEAGQPPDFAFCMDLAEYISELAFDERLVDLADAIGPFSNLFAPDALDRVTLLNAKTEQKALYALPVGRSTNHIHVWKRLLEDAGFTLEDVPGEWDAFWSFWCDRVQPAVRQATGRDDIWGIGLAMSPNATDTWFEFLQFVAAYEADYVGPDGGLIIDDPKIRQKLVETIDAYTTIYRKGCTPPDAVTWTQADNNARFLAQTTVMTANETLSIPNALKRERPGDYQDNVATIEWPLGPTDKPFPIGGTVFSAVVFKDGDHTDTAKDFVRFLVREGWLAHYLNFSAERVMPAMPKLLEQPFWLDPSDRHRMAAVMQVASRPLLPNYAAASGDRGHDRVATENVWGVAIERVALGQLTPEQAIDEAIVRIKEILGE
jgi:multiple sugar transport system substrate-binding protein